MVINDAHGVDAAGFSVFCYIGEIAAVSLPHFSEGIFFESFPILHVRIAGSLQVVVADDALDGVDADGCIQESGADQLSVDLCGVEPREFLLDAVDFLDGDIA